MKQKRLHHFLIYLFTILLFQFQFPARTEGSVCSNVTATLSHDYTHIIGSADLDEMRPSSTLWSYQWLVNETPFICGDVNELLFLHFDNSVTGSGGELPVQAQNISYTPGKWNGALAPTPDSELTYSCDGNLDLMEGTIEMWAATRLDGDDPMYSENSHYLFHYLAPNGDYIAIAQAGDTGVLYAGGIIDGQWQSAYNGSTSTRSWSAGQWHHVAYIFSASGNFMRFYLDGIQVANTNEGHYYPPDPNGTEFSLGGSRWGSTADYFLDEVRILNQPASDQEIRLWAQRPSQPRACEQWLDADPLNTGDTVRIEFTHPDANSLCSSDALVYPGIPLFNANPLSTLLAPNTDSLAVSVESLVPTQCRYAVGSPLPFEEMTIFDSGEGTTFHQTMVLGLDVNPTVVNLVYLRCDAEPAYVYELQYRCLSLSYPSYPRTGNLWGLGNFYSKGLEYCGRIDLWLGADFYPDDIPRLRQLNPDILILTSINTVENRNLPDDYYLKDIYGNRVETWPGSYRLNLTKAYVAEYQAYFAYQRILDSHLMIDGCFFDNIMTTQSWVKDIYGNSILIDADEDGIEDDPEEFDAVWKAGVFHELEVFRQFMPNAIVNGHSASIYEEGISDVLNGISFGFYTADVLEEKMDFADFWNRYDAWLNDARPPRITMIESAPHDQIGYGYGYGPWNQVPETTLEFARTYYPYVRFGLAFTLMHDGYFAHEFGDMWHGNDWWYDELDFDLGYPIGPAEFIVLEDHSDQDVVDNGSFEEPFGSTWSMWAKTSTGCAASLTRDTTTAADGQASARIDITQTSGENWEIELHQYDRSLNEGVLYDLIFWAKSDISRSITVATQKGSPDWDNFGLHQDVDINEQWQEYTVSFTANATTTESRLQFRVGQTTGTVWVDNVRLYPASTRILQRKFTKGLVYLNSSREEQTLPVPPGYRRLNGSQAPLYQYILDNESEAFSCDAAWQPTTYDSGEWKATGPYYHDWGPSCHETTQPGSQAQWTLSIPEEDIYTIEAWFPDAPDAAGWTPNALFEVVAGETVVASAILNQTQNGDRWHQIAQVSLAPQDGAYVRLSHLDSTICIADALHVYSQSRYNNGQIVSSVTLQGMDGIILELYTPPADINHDNTVDLLDFSILASQWQNLPEDPSADIAPDIRDNIINIHDLFKLALQWLEGK
ncbi:MAG: carbohydrate binding domain-containing protein [Sedimentisphaerales bacterium]|nr:carbohydrate binding domain-containing protein [Sedimentisphaerales bacterium]